MFIFNRNSKRASVVLLQCPSFKRTLQLNWRAPRVLLLTAPFLTLLSVS